MVFVKRENTEEAAAALARLKAIGDRYRRLAEQLEQLTVERDQAIRQASDAGATRRDVAEAAGLTAGRVQHIVARDQ